MNKSQWLKYFDEEYYINLNPKVKSKKQNPLLINNIWQRAEGYKLIFTSLLEVKDTNFKIIETGTCRSGRWSDGASSILFSDFVDNFGGTVESVDISINSIKKARRLVTSKSFTVTQDDSLNYLKKYKNLESVDFFYLDSYDVDYENDLPSAKHHLEEFKIIEPFLKNTIVCIDDNTRFCKDNNRTGKGRLIVEYLESKNIKPIYDNYMIIYKF